MPGQGISPWRMLLGFCDAVGLSLLLAVAALAYYNGSIPSDAWNVLKSTALIASAFLIAINYLFGLYNRVWQYATAETGVTILASVTISQVLAGLVSRYLIGSLPFGVWLTAWLGTLVLVGGTRFVWRLIRPYLRKGREAAGSAPRRILIYGAGAHGHMLASQLRESANGRYRLVGFIDDAPTKQRSIVGYGRVLGSSDQLADIIAKYDIDEVIVAIPSLQQDQMRRLHQTCRNAGVRIRVLPHILEMLESPEAARLRPVNIEDLLGRRLSPEDVHLHENYIEGKIVLITGAGGSIGSELSKQVCHYRPKAVILLGRGENRIHWTYLRLRELYPNVEIIPVIANVAVGSSVEYVLSVFRPDIIIHAAAHKHVYLMEYVPAEAARNNVLATARLAELAEQYNVERFIFISTDKAASPRSVMGATKRMAEILLTLRPHRGTTFICVRFGNVLGSEGSVLEIFKRQWEAGQPLTVTHPEATRFFMSIPEACFLVLQAGALGRHGDIFLLDMGEPVRILDLARDFVILQGGNPDEPGVIKITGLRPGEKLHETLTNPDEQIIPTEDKHIMRVRCSSNDMTWEKIVEHISQLEKCVEEEDVEAVCQVLSQATGAELRAENSIISRRQPSPETAP
ncbi:MAG: polysaccharide biosynthesis protein [Armatimonadetes bacterium]|nr:polysaccharide biosynthesis protein [Armatimonadota bacterium]